MGEIGHGGVSVEWAQFVSWVFYGLITSIALFTVRILTKMQESIEKLNIHTSELLVHNEYQKRTNEHFLQRINELERRNGTRWSDP